MIGKRERDKGASVLLFCLGLSVRPERNPENLVFFILLKEDLWNWISPRTPKIWIWSHLIVIICFVPDFNGKNSIPNFIRNFMRNWCWILSKLFWAPTGENQTYFLYWPTNVKDYIYKLTNIKLLLSFLW